MNILSKFIDDDDKKDDEKEELISVIGQQLLTEQKLVQELIADRHNRERGHRVHFVSCDGRAARVSLYAPEHLIEALSISLEKTGVVVTIDGCPPVEPFNISMAVDFNVPEPQFFLSDEPISRLKKHDKHSKPWSKRNRNKLYGIRGK